LPRATPGQLARREQSSSGAGVQRTRPAIFRSATMSCCRRSAFSATSSTRRRTRSAANPETNRRRSITCQSYAGHKRMELVASMGRVTHATPRSQCNESRGEAQYRRKLAYPAVRPAQPRGFTIDWAREAVFSRRDRWRDSSGRGGLLEKAVAIVRVTRELGLARLSYWLSLFAARLPILDRGRGRAPAALDVVLD
jgi:hypothetical protein